MIYPDTIPPEVGWPLGAALILVWLWMEARYRRHDR